VCPESCRFGQFLQLPAPVPGVDYAAAQDATIEHLEGEGAVAAYAHAALVVQAQVDAGRA